MPIFRTKDEGRREPEEYKEEQAHSVITRYEKLEMPYSTYKSRLYGKKSRF